MGPEIRFDPRRGHQQSPMTQERRPPTFRPPTNVPIDTWLNTMGRKRPNEERWHTFDVPRGSSLDYKKEYHASASNKMTHVSSNYKGKNPMSRSQWRRFQRRRKAEKEAARPHPEVSTNVQKRQRKHLERNPMPWAKECG